MEKTTKNIIPTALLWTHEYCEIYAIKIHWKLISLHDDQESIFHVAIQDVIAKDNVKINQKLLKVTIYDRTTENILPQLAFIVYFRVN